MKRCTYCGREHSDEAERCIVDAQALKPARSPLNLSQPLVLPLSIYRRPGVFHGARDDKPAFLTIAEEGLTYRGDWRPIFVRWADVTGIAKETSITDGHSPAPSFGIRLWLKTVLDSVVVDASELECDPEALMRVIVGCISHFGKSSGPTSPDSLVAPLALASSMEIRRSGFMPMVGGVLALGVALLMSVMGTELPAGRDFDFLTLILPLPWAGLCLVLLLWAWRAYARADPAMILAQDGLSYQRLRTPLFIPWHQVSEVSLTRRVFSARIRITMKGSNSETASLDVQGLEEDPAVIFHLISKYCGRLR